MEFLDLTPFPTAVLTLYSDPFDNSSIVNTWSTDDAGRGFFRDRKNGQVEFYMIDADTADLGNQQYTMKVRLYKDSTHMYTVYEGILDVRA